MKGPFCRVRTLAAAGLAVQVAIAMASPTSNEFTFCHRLAAASFFECLEEKSGQTDRVCLDSALRQKDRCYAEVKASHRRDQGRFDAEKALREKKDAEVRHQPR